MSKSKLNRVKIIELTEAYQCSPYSTEELDQFASNDAMMIATSMYILNIKSSGKINLKLARGDWFGAVKLIDNITNEIAALLIDATMIPHNLCEDLYDEAIDCTKEYKGSLIEEVKKLEG